MARKTIRATILDQAEANGYGDGVNVDATRHVVVQLILEGSPDGTLKFVGTSAGTEPTWASGPSAAHPFAEKRVIDQNGSGSINEGGIDLSTLSNAVYEFKMNTDMVRWINGVISGRSQGKVTLKVMATNDNRNA